MKNRQIWSSIVAAFAAVAICLACGQMANAQTTSSDPGKPQASSAESHIISPTQASILGSWQFVGNGFLGELVIESITSPGWITGRIYGGQRIFGTFDEVSLQMTFLREFDNTNDPKARQQFTGVMFLDPFTKGLVLTGTFNVYHGVHPGRPVYGWYAHKK